ncbi:hypothetical protein QUF90_12900 [Desulfococcaceae bacterium HSG9]|nr:hypothetical protein [Desulfococcaceae bacterium HSG9]
MIKNPIITVWLRLCCVLILLFILAVAIQSSQGGRNPVNIERILSQSLLFVVNGHTLLFSNWFGDIFGAVWSVGFWCALLGTAIQSSRDKVRRWFYQLFIFYIVMSLIGMSGAIVMGLIAAAHA